MSLLHAPCGFFISHVDPDFPHQEGNIGTWGYDFADGGRLVDPETSDLMSYCGPSWISDYSFSEALRYRLADEAASGPATPPARSLVLWGGIDNEGNPFLEPAFVTEARPFLPQVGGDHRLTGATSDGERLFSLDFEMPEIADSDSARAFNFALPVEPGWADALALITLSGPGGSDSLGAASHESVTILLDPRTGQVRAILRDLPRPSAIQAAMGGHAASLGGFEVLFSRGIPDAEAWRR